MDLDLFCLKNPTKLITKWLEDRMFEMKIFEYDNKNKL